MVSDAVIQRIRSRFPIFQRKIYLNSCSQGALSDAVEAAFREYLDSWQEAGSPWELWIQRYDEVRAQFARLIGASAEEVAVLPSASAAINAVASALDFGARHKVLLGEFEFPTVGHIWLAQRQRGAKIQFLEAQGDVLPGESYRAAVDEKTSIVPITHVCFKNGFRSQVAQIARWTHEKGALVLMDDYQDCGTRPIDVKSLDVDFYVSGTLKYLLGPPGLAFLYVRKELAAKMTPTISGWFAQQNPFAFDVRHVQLARGARRFESGTPPIPNLYAASAGMALLVQIGLENVAWQIARLARALIDGARELGIHVKTPLDSVGPLVVLKCNDVEAVLTRLAALNIIASGRHDGLRVSFHVHNTLDDVREVLGALKDCRELMVCEPQAV
jgi:selenocysteine lyase/cysteine desulfurase